MLAKLKALLDQSLQSNSIDTPQALEQRLQLASAVLLLEVARSDYRIEASELEGIRQGIQSCFSLPDETIELLMEQATSKVEEIIDFHQFTSLLNKQFSLEQKCTLVENMWRIGFADGTLDIYEDQFIRKISDLLYLRHSEMLAARERARKTLP